MSPPLSEALIYHRGVALAGRDAEPHHHFLREIRDGQKQQKNPEQARAVLRTGLHVSGNRPRIVIRFHDDEAGPHHHKKREKTMRKTAPYGAPLDGTLQAHLSHGSIRSSLLAKLRRRSGTKIALAEAGTQRRRFHRIAEGIFEPRLSTAA